MAFNLISGKLERGDWSCGAANDVPAPETSRTKPGASRNAVMAFGAGALLGLAFLKWRSVQPHLRSGLPENRRA